MTAAKKRGVGRPKGSGAGREYTERLNVPVTPAQKAAFTAAAGDLGVSVSEWAREACEAAQRAQALRGR